MENGWKIVKWKRSFIFFYACILFYAANIANILFYVYANFDLDL